MLVLAGLVCAPIYIVLGITVTKMGSATLRTIIDVSRTIVVWMVGLILTATTHFKMEHLDIATIALQIVGFFIMT